MFIPKIFDFTVPKSSTIYLSFHFLGSISSDNNYLHQYEEQFYPCLEYMNTEFTFITKNISINFFRIELYLYGQVFEKTTKSDFLLLENIS